MNSASIVNKGLWERSVSDKILLACFVEFHFDKCNPTLILDEGIVLVA